MPIFAAISKTAAVIHAARRPASERSFCGAATMTLRDDRAICALPPYHSTPTPACKRCQQRIAHWYHPVLANHIYWLVPNWSGDVDDPDVWA